MYFMLENTALTMTYVSNVGIIVASRYKNVCRGNGQSPSSYTGVFANSRQTIRQYSESSTLKLPDVAHMCNLDMKKSFFKESHLLISRCISEWDFGVLILRMLWYCK